jgi:hypothetical protein
MSLTGAVLNSRACRIGFDLLGSLVECANPGT